MRCILSAILFFPLFVIGPAFGLGSDGPAQNQQVDEAKVAEIQSLLQKWTQLRAGMTVEEVEAIVGPLNQKRIVEALATVRHMAPQSMQDSPSVVNMTQEISQSYIVRGTTISFKLVFNAKLKLVKYWLDSP